MCESGTGAGLPGIPLKIVRPDIRLTLLDSRKTVAFCAPFVRRWGLRRRWYRRVREEYAHQPEAREGYDWWWRAGGEDAYSCRSFDAPLSSKLRPKPALALKSQQELEEVRGGVCRAPAGGRDAGAEQFRFRRSRDDHAPDCVSAKASPTPAPLPHVGGTRFSNTLCEVGDASRRRRAPAHGRLHGRPHHSRGTRSWKALIRQLRGAHRLVLFSAPLPQSVAPSPVWGVGCNPRAPEAMVEPVAFSTRAHATVAMWRICSIRSRPCFCIPAITTVHDISVSDCAEWFGWKDRWLLQLDRAPRVGVRRGC